MSSFSENSAAFSSALNQVTVPDLWQQQAVSALREGKDVVVHAPTGAGKTLIFELWSKSGKNRGQAIYTVPTRALANDKLAEWRARGWDVGIATGDLSDNLGAPILVATLETQKNRLIQGDGPALLIVDEYQMIGDADRGLNYELALALAPAKTQFLLLSGSVGNPQDVVKWLRRLGRDATLIKYEHRPVPLEEVHANHLSFHVPGEIKGYWPRLVAKCLAEDLGPILIFAPRRHAAEQMAADLSRNLPNPNPLTLTLEQKNLVGDHLAKLLKTRICHHHSGLSYGARAGVIEPLAKAGQLRVVVATMGLAAGINFSLRSVALAAATYRRDYQEQPLKPDEILQMFGRAGRRGLDETGYVIVTANELRLLDAHAAHLARSGSVDWSALLGLMKLAAKNHRDPFAEAVRVQDRLFTSKPIFLGVEDSLRHPDMPCGLKTDAERARRVRQSAREIRNSRGQWERIPPFQEKAAGEIFICAAPPVPTPAGSGAGAGSTNPPELPPSLPLRQPEGRAPGLEAETPGETGQKCALRPVLSEPAALEKTGQGHLCVLEEKDGLKTYGRAITLADKLHDGRVIIAKWVRRMTDWKGRQTTYADWKEKIVPLAEAGLARQKTPVIRWQENENRIMAQVSLAQLTLRVPVDSHGTALWKPVERDVMQPDCARCQRVPFCRELNAGNGTALLWRRLRLVDASGIPTRRGEIVSCFSQGHGLAIAAALEDSGYPLEELIFDIANLDAGFRFCGEENRWAGRLAMVCHQVYGSQSIPGYLENGVPPKYGAGAETVLASVHRNPANKHAYVTDMLGSGDIDRIIIEWRSLLRQIIHAPDMEWNRWRGFQKLAATMLDETDSPTLTQLPPLDYSQTRRVEHKLLLRRH